jgi:heme-degrading monooxygenase HmoA
MGGFMIARTWHGVTHASKANEYLDYLKKTGVAEYQKTEGNRGVYVLQRLEGDKAHFLLLTLWDSEDAIKRFAGSDMEKAKYYPEDEAFLFELEPKVMHYEVLVKP